LSLRRNRKTLDVKDKKKNLKKIERIARGLVAPPPWSIGPRGDGGKKTKKNLLNQWAYNQIVESIYLYTFVDDKDKEGWQETYLIKND
jgi:hypothetical protein